VPGLLICFRKPAGLTKKGRTDFRGCGLGEATGYIVMGAAGMLVIILLGALIFAIGSRRGKKNFEPDAISRSGARLVSKARYRGRRVFHYSDGEVVAETRRGFKPFESFDAYRFYVDRR
jgi:hypothetical protein